MDTYFWTCYSPPTYSRNSSINGSLMCINGLLSLSVKADKRNYSVWTRICIYESRNGRTSIKFLLPDKTVFFFYIVMSFLYQIQPLLLYIVKWFCLFSLHLAYIPQGTQVQETGYKIPPKNDVTTRHMSIYMVETTSMRLMTRNTMFYVFFF